MAELELFLPKARQVSHLVGELLDRKIGINLVDAVEYDQAVTGIFATEHGDSGIVVFSDIELANNAGAALSLMPPENAEAGINACEVPEVTMENFREVINVLGALLNRRDGAHVKLWYVLDETIKLPPGLPEALDAVGQREDFSVDVEGYGKGHMSFRIWN